MIINHDVDIISRLPYYLALYTIYIYVQLEVPNNCIIYPKINLFYIIYRMFALTFHIQKVLNYSMKNLLKKPKKSVKRG